MRTNIQKLSQQMQLAGTVLIVLLGVIEMLPLIIIGAAGLCVFAIGVVEQWEFIITAQTPAGLVINGMHIFLNAGIPTIFLTGYLFLRMVFSQWLWILIAIQSGVFGIMLYAKDISERTWSYRP